ncbi:PAS domain S-box protein [uncultured Desulfosarcina sp.]|uniref:PAS domain S-box protein n=1 Tax=uncultured Desulfosarcina sp. TaxID=218289 RepID=UPI0029C70264|nr:PAS domain S-box protein [uncultured Desulfosarcina sp.]
MSQNIDSIISNYEQQYKIFEKSIIDVIWVVDVEAMGFTYISPSVNQVTGYTPEEIKALPMEKLLAPESYRKGMDYLTEGHRKYKMGKSIKRKAEFELLHKNGSPFWVEITAKFFKGDQGRTQLFGAMRNVTKQHALAKKRDELLLKLEESLSRQKALEAENEMLRGLLPICSNCKKIRDDSGKWWHVEEYIAMHSEADFSHTICPPCRKKIYPKAN